MKVYIEKDSKSLDIKLKRSERIDGKKLLAKLKINPSSVILVKNDEVVLEDEILENDDEIKILSVVSGG
ncbi:MAG: MoaD/ThiS family protein [Candidatus Woesearchaeota archaeon]